MVLMIVLPIGKEPRKYLVYNMFGIPKMMPIVMPKVSLSTVIHLVIVAVFMGMLFFSKVLWDKNEALKKTNIEITLVYEEKVKALALCSGGVLKLKERETKITKEAVAAVTEAKKEALVQYKASNAFLFKKPKAPVVTAANVQDFGGTNVEVQIKDYLATQKMINDMIDVEMAIK